jgi:transcriptional/translational regulatory protein YebC/TACO1
MRTIFSKNGGSVATQGSVAYQFTRAGEIRLDTDAGTAEDIMLAAIEAGAEDVESDEDGHLIRTSPNELGSVASALRTAGFAIQSEKFVSIPQTPAMIEDPAIARQVFKLHDQLDEYQDTVNVFTNFEVPDEVIELITA